MRSCIAAFSSSSDQRRSGSLVNSEATSETGSTGITWPIRRINWSATRVTCSLRCASGRSEKRTPFSRHQARIDSGAPKFTQA